MTLMILDYKEKDVEKKKKSVFITLNILYKQLLLNKTSECILCSSRLHKYAQCKNLKNNKHRELLKENVNKIKAYHKQFKEETLVVPDDILLSFARITFSIINCKNSINYVAASKQNKDKKLNKLQKFKKFVKNLEARCKEF